MGLKVEQGQVWMPGMRARRILLVTAIALMAAFALTPYAHAFDAIPPLQPIHQEITRTALGGGIFMDDDALKRVIDANVASDFHQFEAQRHFDNAATPDVACIRWKERVDRWFNEAVAFAGPGDATQRALVDRMSALERFGWVIHALQDFYSHSNYVELSLAGSVPPVDQILLDRCGLLPPTLQTGYFDLRYGLDGCPLLLGGPPAPPAPYKYCHSQINKDNPRRPHYAAARSLAVAATKAAWKELHRRIVTRHGEDKATDAECLFAKLAWGKDLSCRRSP